MTTILAHRLRDLAHLYEDDALKRLRHPAGTREAEIGIQAALAHLQMAASYHSAANENEEQDQS